MTIIDEVIAFSREYINNRSYRTVDRKQKIKKALRSLTGEVLNASCSTCYIEALFKIIKRFEMATPKGYELKQGVLLQAFGHPEKTVTNKQLTDEIAEWYLQHYPQKAIYFSKIPANSPVSQKSNVNLVSAIPPEIRIIPPVVKPPEVDDVAKALIESATGEPKKGKKPSKAKK